MGHFSFKVDNKDINFCLRAGTSPIKFYQNVLSTPLIFLNMTGTFSIQRQKRVLWNQEIEIKLLLYKLTKSSYNLLIFYLNPVLNSNLNYLTYGKSSWKDIESFRKRFRVQVVKIFLKVFIKTGVKEVSPSFYLMVTNTYSMIFAGQ